MQSKTLKRFTCHGRESECLSCPFNDCIRALCEVNGEFMPCSFNIEKPYSDKKGYYREYYRKNREKRLLQMKEYKERKKNAENQTT